MYSKTLRDKMEKFLEVTPLARERSSKDRAIARILEGEHVGLNAISIEVLTKVVTNTLSLDRAYRKILQERPDLRGSDYEEKAGLERKAKEKLGYRPYAE